MSRVIRTQPGSHQDQDPENQIQLQPLITNQPREQLQPARGTVWMALPPPIPGVPQGLEYLTYLESVTIHQIKEFTEIMTGWETRNKYVMKNANGEQCYYAFEESDCFQRQCCAPNHEFKMHVVDNFNREVLTIDRPFKWCAGGCFCFASIPCCQYECTVQTPTTGLLGTIRQRDGCCATNYEVLDKDGNLIFEIDGDNYCVLLGCGDKKFEINLPDYGDTVGAITKKWGGCCREAFTDADTFAVTFPKDLDVNVKALLLGATFLIDFMHFENQR